jgi:hypothetical protein
MAQYANKRSRVKAIQRSFELLCQYLNFGDDDREAGQVQNMLCSDYVQPFFEEYAGDYLMLAEGIEEIELHELVAWCQENNAFQSKRYSYCPSESGAGVAVAVDKSGWGALDHAARFAVQLLQYSWVHNGAWSHGSWDPNSDEGDIEFWQVWMILRHLQAEWETANLEDWTEESLEKMITQLRVMKL